MLLWMVLPGKTCDVTGIVGNDAHVENTVLNECFWLPLLLAFALTKPLFSIYV